MEARCSEDIGILPMTEKQWKKAMTACQRWAWRNQTSLTMTRVGGRKEQVELSLVAAKGHVTVVSAVSRKSLSRLLVTDTGFLFLFIVH